MSRRSYSQMNHLMICGESYRRHYIDGDKRPIGLAGKTGFAIDKAVTASLESKIHGGKLLSTAEVVERAKSEISGLKKRDVHLTRAEQTSTWKNLKDAAMKEAADLAALYNDTVAPKLDPVAVQLELEPTIPGTDISVLMYLDVLERDLTIRDTKRWGRSKGKDAAANSLQLALYRWGLRAEAEEGEPADSPLQVLDVLIPATSRTGPRYEPSEARLTIDDEQRALGRMVEADYAIDQGAFIPADPTSWKCSENYCVYYPECAFGRGVAPTTFAFSSEQRQEAVLQVEASVPDVPPGPWDEE